MGPSRHTRAGASAAAGSSSSSRPPSSPSASALSTRGSASNALSKTPTRASPYARTPTKQSSALSVGPSTPVSRTNSPMMLREIFSMISPFRGHSRAKSSAAFGSADDAGQEEDEVDQRHDEEVDHSEIDHAPTRSNGQAQITNDDRMIEDAEEGVSAAAEASSSPHFETESLHVPRSSRSARRSASPRPSASSSAPTTSLPLANSALVTPGLRRQVMSMPSEGPATPGPSTPLPQSSQTSPVSRNYDLLARFFSEKQRGGQGGLTEVEVEGCIRLIEESMATGRNLESEFARSYPASYGQTYPNLPTSGFAPSSRASSIAPPAMPSSQSMNSLFHPGTSRLTASSSAYSFLAPRAPASQSNQLVPSASSSRRRPIYLGPGMSGLSLNRRRPLANSSRASALSKTQAQGCLPRSSTDPSLARHARDADDALEASDRPAGPEEPKRRRIVIATADAAPSAQSRPSAADQTVQFESAYEKEARQSSRLAKDLAASPAGTNASALKRPAPAADTAASAQPRTSPPKVPTRTASAIQDILKTTPPVRPPTKPELVNPYQSAAPLSVKSKRTPDDEDPASPPVRRSARTSMLTRAKARESARAAEKSSPPKESVLDLIERTAPKLSAGRKKVDGENAEPQRNGKAPVVESPPAPAATIEPSTEERKLQKTEEVQRRLEALTKAKSQQDQNATSRTSNADASTAKAAKPATALVPPQYTATKPKKPSPLSAAFQAPDSPSSDSEAPAPQPRAGAIAQPNLSFGSPVSASSAKPPSSGFSFSAPKPAAAATSAPSTGFSFSAPAAPASTSAAASAQAPAPAPSSGFSFSPKPAAPAAPKPAAAPSSGFSFSAPTYSTPAPSLRPSAAAKTQPAPSAEVSPRAEVLAEDAAKLPKFEWQAPAIQTASAGADRALRDEIKAAAEAALPKFDFVYEIETPREKVETKAAPTVASAPSAGFSFSSPVSTSAGSTAAPSAPATVSAVAESSEDGSSDDPSKPQSSGLLGEGEGEEGEQTLLEVRAKIWKLDMETKSWKDLGVCITKLKHNSETGKHRLLARNEANGKVAVNFMAYKGLKTTLDKTVNSFLGFDGKDPTQYRLKIKTEDQAAEFKQQLETAAAKA